jgi:hypothetical protein
VYPADQARGTQMVCAMCVIDIEAFGRSECHLLMDHGGTWSVHRHALPPEQARLAAGTRYAFTFSLSTVMLDQQQQWRDANNVTCGTMRVAKS